MNGANAPRTGARPAGALDEAQMIPAIRWMAEQIPGGFFVYQAEALIW